MRLANRPLHLAIEYGGVEATKLLLEHGANPNKYNKEGITPLCMACKSWHKFDDIITLMDLLLEYGADVNGATVNYNTLMDIYTPLGMSMFKNEIKIATALLDRGADVNKAGCGTSPLHIAVGVGHNDMIRLLISRGADINYITKGYHDATALHIAMEWNKPETVELLISLGADTKIRTSRV